MSDSIPPAGNGLEYFVRVQRLPGISGLQFCLPDGETTPTPGRESANILSYVQQLTDEGNGVVGQFSWGNDGAFSSLQMHVRDGGVLEGLLDKVRSTWNYLIWEYGPASSAPHASSGAPQYS